MLQFRNLANSWIFFYDEEDGSNWVIFILSNLDVGEIASNNLASNWEDNTAWDTVDAHFKTTKDREVTRKCQNIFEYKLCLCQFQRLLPPHYCHKTSAKSDNIQQRLLHHQSVDHPSTEEEAISNAQSLNPNVAESMRTPPSDLEIIHPDTAKHVPHRKAKKIDDDIAAAERALDNKELGDEELHGIASNIYDLIGEVEERFLYREYRADDMDALPMDQENENVEEGTDVGQSISHDDGAEGHKQ
eukprot:399584_1